MDRKGDLCRYALEEAWTETLDDTDRKARRQTLRNKVDVAAFTPGRAEGRPLTLSITPPGVKHLPKHERDQTAQAARNALAGMMNYKTTGATASKTAILLHAIQLLAEREENVTLELLIEFIATQDDSLLDAMGRLPTKHLDGLVENLETLRVNKQHLLNAAAEPLNADLLFGRGDYARPGKTRLSVISTKFLGDVEDVQFWVAQLLLELSRWMSKNAADKLHAAVMFDEADLYLPAMSKPATKQPMEDLLRRARSAGLGVMLATQNPGDFDYKCRDNINTWFVGLVKEARAIEKIKPLLPERKADALAKRFAKQQPGEFHVLQAGTRADSVKSDLSAVRVDQVPEETIVELARESRR